MEEKILCKYSFAKYYFVWCFVSARVAEIISLLKVVNLGADKIGSRSKSKIQDARFPQTVTVYEKILLQ